MSREVQFLSKLDHPHIVRFVETFLTELYIAIVTEYIPGGNLKNHLLAQGGSLSESKVSSLDFAFLCTSKRLSDSEVEQKNRGT